jgi:Fe-S-cluster containining protein
LTAARFNPEIPPVREGIPPLREDLEVHHRTNGTVDIRDPFLLQIYTIDADDYSLATGFDGKSNVAELSLKLNQPKKRIREVVVEFQELDLLDMPAVWKKKPNIDNCSPYSQIDTKRGLKVLPIADETAHWTCHGCGVCCHGLAVELTKEEESRIDASLYQDILKGEPFAEDSFLNPDEGAKRTLKQIADDNMACIFLTKEGLCLVHARQGMQAKPDACQMFPAMVMLVPGGKPRLGLRTNCASMYKSFNDGPPVSDLGPHVLRIAQNRGEVHKAPKMVRLFKRSVPFARMDRLCMQMRALFDERGVSAETIMHIDKKLLGGRVKKGIRRYGKLMLAYMEKEESGPAPVEEGAYRLQIRKLARGRDAIHAMRDGRLPPPPHPKVASFLLAQVRHMLYIGGPLNLPDAGYALVGQMLALLGLLHAVSETSSLKVANTAFEVFMMPLLETMEHAWPILDAIDKSYAKALRAEVSNA